MKHQKTVPTTAIFTLIELLVAPACFRSESEKSIKV